MTRWWMDWRRAREEQAFDEAHPDIGRVIREPPLPPSVVLVAFFSGETIDEVLLRRRNRDHWTERDEP